MKRIGFVGLALVGLGLIALALVAFPAASVTAQGDSTPVPFGDLINPPGGDGGGNGGLVIPTATSAGGGFVIPTATPASGGLVIPTATPGGASTGAFPPMSDEQLRALNLQPEDVPAQFAANAEWGTEDIAAVIQQLRDAGLEDAANTFEQAYTQYGWTHSVTVDYKACEPSLPISGISSSIAQLAGVDEARAFIDSDAIRAIFQLLEQQIEPAPNLHGYRVTIPPDTGECFPKETEYGVLFEYWGTLVWVSMTANAETDPALVYGLLDQLVPVVVARLDAAAPAPFPPTPVPAPLGAAQPPLQPPTQPPSLLPTQAPAQPPSVANVALPDLEQLMPSLTDLGLPAPPFQYNASVSGTFTLEQMVATLQGFGLAELANAVQQAGQRDGMVGQVVGVWDTGDQCPDTVGLSLEVDLTLFQTPQGALSYMNDKGIQQAWLNTGVFTSFQPHGDGLLASGTLSGHRCGAVQIYSLVVPQGNVLVTASVIGNVQASQNELVSALELLASYMQDQLSGIGVR